MVVSGLNNKLVAYFILMLPVLANLYNITAELMAYDGRSQIATVRYTLVIAAFDGSLIAGHTQTIGNHPNTDTIRADLGQLNIVKSQVHFAVDTNSLSIHNKIPPD